MLFLDIVQTIGLWVVITQRIGSVCSADICGNYNCNNEGPCESVNGQPYCACIGNKYFKGPNCMEQIDNCLPNPCSNAVCTNALGQPVCGPCATGFGGHLCDVRSSNSFTKLYLHHSRLDYISQNVYFMFTVESLGSESFQLELHADNYTIDIFTTDPKRPVNWKKSSNLALVARRLRLKHTEKLPYNSGFYHTKTGNFWKPGLQQLRLTVTSGGGEQSLMDSSFFIQILPKDDICRPDVELPHGADPFNPLIVDVTQYNIVQVNIRKRCWEGSTMNFAWEVHDVASTILLHSYQPSDRPRLKIHTYPSWTASSEELKNLFMIRIGIEETFNNKATRTVTRCYIYVIPKPVVARIIGGLEREVKFRKSFRLDGSTSRDLAASPHLENKLVFRWTCKSNDDPSNRFCVRMSSKGKIVTIPEGVLNLGMTYQFTLEVRSHSNTQNKITQNIKPVLAEPLLVDIICVRNCENGKFTPSKMLHFMAKCLGCEYNIEVRYTWKVNDVEMSNKQRLVINEAENEKTLRIHVQLRYQDRRGSATIVIYRNDPPKSGECIASPTSGVQMETEFAITCKNFDDTELPLTYEFSIGSFVLDRTTAPSTKLILPINGKIKVEVCNPLRACVIVSVDATVTDLQTSSSLRGYVSKDNKKFSDLLRDSSIQNTIILLEGLASLIKASDDAIFVGELVEQLHLRTLLDIEQFLPVFKTVISFIDPFGNTDTILLRKLLMVLAEGFESVVQDGEIRELDIGTYSKIQYDMASVLDTWILTTEYVKRVELNKPVNEHVFNRIAEQYEELEDFDTDILSRLNNRVKCHSELDRSQKLLGLMAAYLLEPEEPHIITDLEKVYIETHVIEKRASQTLQNRICKIIMSSGMTFDLQRALQSTKLLLQRISTTEDPFWWYPDFYNVSTGVLHFSAFTTNFKHVNQTSISLGEPLEIKLKVNEMTAFKNDTKNYLLGRLVSNADMNIFKILTPKNALLVINFVSTKIDLKVVLQFKIKPTGYQTHKSSNLITKDSPNRPLLLLNKENYDVGAYLGVVPAEHISNGSADFALVPELRKCLSWNFSLDDPQWTSNGCWPDTTEDMTEGLQCFCTHMSIYAGQIHPTTGYALSGVGNLSTSLPINWYMLTLQLVTAISVIVWIIAAYLILRNIHDRLVTIPMDDDHFLEHMTSSDKVIVRFTTGGYPNAFTTAGIILLFDTIHGPLKFRIFQNPKHPQLKRLSTCTVRIPLDPAILTRPISVNLQLDMGGRYPSWYCRFLEITFKGIEKPVRLNVESWMDPDGIQLTEGEKPQKTKFKHWRRFCDNLETLFTNWFLFNPVIGTWKYGNMTLNRFERTLIWVLKSSVIVVIISLSFGWTTLANYEKERDKYMYIRLEPIYIVALVVFRFVLGGFIQFGIRFWIFKYSHETQMKRQSIYAN